MDHELRDSVKESKRRKKVAECLDKLMKERNIRIEEVDSSAWHKLILDAESMVRYGD